MLRFSFSIKVQSLSENNANLVACPYQKAAAMRRDGLICMFRVPFFPLQKLAAYTFSHVTERVCS